MIEIHIVAGLTSLLAGFGALFSPKGGCLHRRSGAVFVAAMLVMLGSAVIIAQFFIPNRVNVTSGLLTAYLVVTSLLTVTRRVDQVKALTAGLAIVAFALGVRAILLAAEGMQSPTRTVDHVPFQPLFMFAFFGVAGALLDLRMLVKISIQGAQRLARHLWRMTAALWIATASFFLGQAKVFPDPVRKVYLLAIPVLIVSLTLFYWLGRVAVRKREIHG